MKHRRTSWHAYAFEILLLSSIGSLVSAQRLRPSPIPQVHAPVNPEYVAYLDAVMADRWQTVTPDGHGLGHIPSPILHDFNFAPGTRPRLGDSPPAAYTLPADRLPPIRNQGTCGSCWAHAVYGSMETGIRPGDTFDFSENHLKNNHGWDWTCCQGGNPWCSNAYFGRWAGPLSEDDDAYDPVEANCHTSTGTPRRHLLDMWFLPTDDPAVLKDVLYHYGGILTGYYAESGYYGSSATAYYYPPSGAATSGNHEVTIVGYDDSYPRTNFNAANRPSADGAWYIRNSWGAFNSLGGYLWISYEDKFCAKETNALYLPPTPPTNVPTIYCVDEMGWVGYLGYGSPWDTTWAANRFTKGGGEEVLKYIGFYTVKPSTSYQLEVWRNPSTSNPRSGTQISLAAYPQASGTYTYAGYHTVQFGAGLTLPASDSAFSVVVKYITPDYYWPVPTEMNSGTAVSQAVSSGCGFLNPDPSVYGWYHETRYDYCIKAFTYPGPLAVRLASLKAEGERGQVRLRWETANEVGVAGFHVLRAESADGPYVRVNKRLIAAEGRPGANQRYQFVDKTARPGRTWWYRLVEVEEGGRRTEYPEIVSATAEGSGLYDLLPEAVRGLLSS